MSFKRSPSSCGPVLARPHLFLDACRSIRPLAILYKEAGSQMEYQKEIKGYDGFGAFRPAFWASGPGFWDFVHSS